TIGEDVQMHHFSYVGDASIGPRANVAAGVITCNFEPDGKKYRTEVGSDVFIGSDTMLIAPVTLGDGAMTGAGPGGEPQVPGGRGGHRHAGTYQAAEAARHRTIWLGRDRA